MSYTKSPWLPGRFALPAGHHARSEPRKPAQQIMLGLGIAYAVGR